MKNFTDLTVWKEGHTLVLNIYKTLKTLPSEEKYGLVSQMQRAAVSITSNIAEGFGRRSYNDKTRFYVMAVGSLAELQNQMIVCKDLPYIDVRLFDKLWEQSITVYKLLNAIIKLSKQRSASYQ